MSPGAESRRRFSFLFGGVGKSCSASYIEGCFAEGTPFWLAFQGTSKGQPSKRKKDTPQVAVVEKGSHPPGLVCFPESKRIAACGGSGLYPQTTHRALNFRLSAG